MNEQVAGDDIIIEFRKGNSKALDAIFKLYYAALCYFAGRILSNKEEAEDIVAESFFKLWKAHENFDSMYGIRAFLYVTTRNACLNYLKQADRVNRQQMDVSHLLDPDEEKAFAEVTRAEVLREVYAAIETLPTQCKKIVRMSFIEGLKNHEIAEQLNISVHTVKNQKVRGIYLLKMKLLGANMIMFLLLNAHLAGKN
jgi:RNA polymerase sigma-70 factor (family 1)